jgi:tRNA threonylcarbamoyladenosine biosynthesis protein TsaE
MKLTTNSEEETRQLGRLIGELAPPGLVLALRGDLGCGKTVLVRGLARGLGVSGQTPITSPTFTLINEYSGRRRLFHADLYRIVDCGELEETGFDEIFTEEAVVAVEWSDRCEDRLPSDRLDIRIADPAPDARILRLAAGGQISADLVKALAMRIAAA